MRINQNISAMNTYSRLTAANNSKSNSLAKLSSGLRINKAGDDAAGLAISEKMRGQVGGLKQAVRNAQDGISLIQTAEGALNETHSILQRMRELAVQAANATNTEADRKEIQKEINQLTSEINRIANTTEFNTQKLLNGEKDATVTISPAEAAKEAVKGVYTISGDFKGDITIDGETFEYDENGDGSTKFKNVEQLISLIEANSYLSEKYSAEEEGGKLKLTQNTGYESASTPDVSGGTLTIDKAGAEAVEEKDAVMGEDLQFQIGANQGQGMSLSIGDMRAEALGITEEGTLADFGVTDGTSSEVKEQALSVLTHEAAGQAVTKFQEAIDIVSAERSKLGSIQNRLDHTINNLTATAENLSAAESRIRDVDMAEEMMEFTKNNILSQAATAMLAQANQMPNSVLQLLQ
jgi:flagellin